MRLQQKAVLFTLPFILIPTLILGWLSIRYTESAQRQIANASLQTDVNYRSDTLNRYFESERTTLNTFLNSSEFKKVTSEWSLDNDPLMFESQLSQASRVFFNTYPNAVAIRVFDNSLSEVTTFWADGPLSNFNTSGFLKSYNDWHILDHESSNTPLSMIQTPWFSSDVSGHSMLNSIGFIQLISKPNWLETLRLDSNDGNSFSSEHQIMITSQKGKILFAYPQFDLGGELPAQIFQKLKDSATTHSAVETTNNGLQMDYAGRIVENRFLVLYGHKKQSVFAADTAYTWISILTVLLTIVISPILLYVNFSRMVVEPIEKLTSAKRQVAQGNLDIKLDMPRKDEIGDLFAAFNVMVRQLIVYRENESDSRLKLEYKVRERTEELESTNTALAKSNKALESAKELSEQANELKSAFVANISHEIRTPLTAILGFTEQVLSTELKDPHQAELLNRVLKSGRHLLALINDILDLSKIESNKLDIEIQEIQLFDLLQDVNTLLASQANKKDLDFNFSFRFPLPAKIWTDPTRLRQILINLASNAIKFTEAGSVNVDVWFDPDTNKLFVKVIDTGIGMSEEVQKRIFSPFVQADVSISRKFGGTGLGLVISNSLAKLLGGNIELESQLGRGSTFTINISVANDKHPLGDNFINNEADLAAITTKYESQEVYTEKQISGKVLVAEDVEDNQYLFAMILDSLSLDYEIVGNGKLAVEKVLTNDYDLILMDMQMPIMGGLEATKLIRQAGEDTPIYALTANVMREDVALHIEAGCDGTIGKPVDRAELITIIKSHLTSESNDESKLINDDTMKDLITFYKSQLEKQVELLQTLNGPQDIEALKGECHKIKGSAGSYGYDHLTEIAGELESACRVLIEQSGTDGVSNMQWQTVQLMTDELIADIKKVVSGSDE